MSSDDGGRPAELVAQAPLQGWPAKGVPGSDEPLWPHPLACLGEFTGTFESEEHLRPEGGNRDHRWPAQDSGQRRRARAVPNRFGRDGVDRPRQRWIDERPGFR